jgi:hypothetical protein
MTSKNFQRKINADKYRKVVDKHCIHFYEPIKHILYINEMEQYCLANFGEPRSKHPLDEVIHGYVSNFEGDWAVQWIYSNITGSGSNVFWFKNREDKMLFNLTFFDG